jgi:hypothetical protein
VRPHVNGGERVIHREVRMSMAASQNRADCSSVVVDV